METLRGTALLLERGHFCIRLCIFSAQLLHLKGRGAEEQNQMLQVSLKQAPCTNATTRPITSRLRRRFSSRPDLLRPSCLLNAFLPRHYPFAACFVPSRQTATHCRATLGMTRQQNKKLVSTSYWSTQTSNATATTPSCSATWPTIRQPSMLPCVLLACPAFAGDSF